MLNTLFRLCNTASVTNPHRFTRFGNSLSATILAMSFLSSAHAETQVGYINGDLSVSNGFAQYEVPLTVPPGIAEVAPALSIRYQSLNPNGLLGIGWSIKGFSAVHRCGSNFAQDGVKKTVKYNAEDNFCLGQKRLMPISGVKGANGTEYRTEYRTDENSFKKIVSYGTAGNGPAWFKVWDNDGNVIEYGNTADSRIELQGQATVKTWAVSKFSDTSGNSIDYAYTEINANNEYVPHQISYGPNKSVQIRFTYDEVTDLPVTRLAGANFRTSKRLNNISTYVSGLKAKSWQFGFQHVDSKPSRLISIQECGSNGKCLASTTFEWQEYARKIYTTPEPGFVDFNGDGLIDKQSYRLEYIREPDESYTEIRYSIQLNNGDGYDSAISRYIDSPVNYSKSAGYANNCLFFDANEDGFADLNCSDSIYLGDLTAVSSIQSAQRTTRAALTNKLQKYTTPLLKSITSASRTDIEYSHISDDNVHTRSDGVSEVRGQIFLVNSVVTDDGLGGKNTTTYRYGDARQDRTGRGLLGVAWMEATTPHLNMKVRHEYRQDFPFIGQIARKTRSLIDNTLLSQRIYEFSDHQTHAGKAHYAYVSKATFQSYELNSALMRTITTEASDLDTYGNPAQLKTTTTGDGKTFLKTITTSYQNNTSNWFIGQPSTVQETNTHADGSVITHSHSYTYDDNTGLLTSHVNQPGTAFAFTTTYAYDSVGNVIQETRQPLSGTARTRTSEYDANKQFLIQSTNAANHNESYAVDALFGNVTRLTGPNGLVSHYQYDGFGNVIKETLADSTTTDITYRWANECTNAPTHNAYCKTTSVSGQSPRDEYFNIYGQLLRSVSTGFNGRKVYTDTEYNNKGQVTRVSRPYYAGDEIIWATTTYDDMGRTLSVSEPGPEGSTKTTSTAYNGLTTVNTNAKGRVKTTVTDAQGNIVSVLDPEGASVTYTYDPLGNLIKTRDDQGNETTITYDLFGRKTSMNDPDMGIWQYSYNGYGELNSQTDAKGQTSTMTYDVLGRMISRTEAEGTSTWEYDTAANGIGKLAKVTGPNGYEQNLTYDSLGRLLGNTTIADARSLTITNEYDQYSRVKKQIRPQGFITENVYNDLGYLQAVRAPKSWVADYEAGHVFEELAKLIAEGMSQAQALALEAANLRAKAQQYTDQANALYDNHGTAQQLRDAADKLNAEAAVLETKAGKYLAWVSALSAHPTYGPVIRQSLVTHRQAWEDSPSHRMWAKYYADSVISQTFARFIPIINGGIIIFVPKVDTTDGVPATDKINYIRFYGEELRQQAATKRAAAAVKLAKIDSRDFDNLTPEDQQAVNEADSLVQQAELALAEAERVDARINELEKAADSDTDAQNDDAYVYFWRAKERDASGRLINEIYGNGITSEYTYNTSNGLMTSQRTGLLNVQDIRHLTYQYDNLNNITQRADLVNNAQESFTYDGLDRLKTSQVASQLQGNAYSKTVTYAYDTLGNITHKSDVGDYSYGTGINNGAGPHAVIAAGSNSYQYDANGNMVSGAGRTIQWSSFHKPVQITRDGNTVGFTYAPDRSRYLKTDANGGKTLYLGKMYELTTKGQAVTHKQFIYAGSELVAQQETGLDAQGQSKPVQTRYMHRDNLGSVDTITDGVGNVVERMSFDPFGERRPSNWREATPGISLIPVLTNRGFTGHETLDSVGLIHMNGRVYDATLGRFLSADPFIQAPLNTQSFNRYNYVMNSPLVYTDPSGYFGIGVGTLGALGAAVGRATGNLGGGNSRGGDGDSNRGVRHGETITVTARAPDHRGDVYGGESRSDVGVKTGRDPDVPPDNIDVVPVIVITATPIDDYEDFFGSDRNWFTDYLYMSYKAAKTADFEYTIWKVLQSLPDGGPAISFSLKLTSVLAVAKVPVVRTADDVISLPHTDKFGNIISRTPKSVQDQMTLEAAKRGEGIVNVPSLSDPKFKGMQKMELETISAGGKKSNVHYVRDPETGQTMDFKFKKHSTDYLHRYEKN